MGKQKKDVNFIDNVTIGIKKLTDVISGSAKDRFSDSNTEKAIDIVRNIRENKGESSGHTDIIDNYIVFTGHGGTGASTIVANVANEIANRGLSVIVLDLDIMYPSQHMYLGITEDISDDLVTALTGESVLGDCIYSKKKYHVMYANNATMLELIKCNSGDAIENYNELIYKLRELYDIVIVDAPLRVDDKLINTALYICDNIYLVWDEGISSITTTERAKTNMALSGISTGKLKVILNKRTKVRYGNEPFNKTGVELIEVLPFSIDIIESGLAGEIFCRSGASANKSSIEFEQGIKRLVSKILKIGGYVDGVK